MPLFSPRWTHSRRIEYSGCDQETYQQDLVIHRTVGRDYEEEVGGLKVWHIFIGPTCRADYGDLRFTDHVRRELAYYLWPDFDEESARVTVRLEGADRPGSVTIHYGNPGAESESDGDGTYLFFDHFDGDELDASRWTVYRRAVSVENGYARFRGTSGTKARVRSNIQIGPNVIVEQRLKITVAQPGVFHFMEVARSDDPGAGGTDYYWNYGGGVSYQVVAGGRTGGVAEPVRAPTYGDWRTFRTYQMVWTLARLTVYQDGVSRDYTRTRTPQLPCYIWFQEGASGEMHVDYCLVRTYSAAPPALLRTSRGMIVQTPPIGAILRYSVPTEIEILYDIEIGAAGSNLSLLYHILRAQEILPIYDILRSQELAAVYQIEVLKDLLTTYHILIKQEAVIPYDIPGGVTFTLVYSIDAEAVLDYQVNVTDQIYGPDRFWDLVITRKLNQVHTATFELWTEGSDTSQVREGEVLRIFYNDEVRFSGEIRSIRKDDMSGIWSIVCESGACRLADSAISGVLDYKSTPADQILRAVLPGPAWVGSIEAGPAVDYRQEYADTLSHVVNVANVIGYDWRVRQQEDRYQVTSRTATTITVAGAGWPASSQGLAGRVVVVTSGKAKFRAGIIISHTTDTLTFAGSSWVSDGLAAGDMIRIFGPFRLDVQKRIGSPTPRKTFTVNETIFDSCTGRDIERVANSIVVPGTASITQDRRSIISGCTTLMTPITVTEAILRSNLSSSATEIPVDSTSSFPPSGTIQIEGERIAYTEKTLSSFTGCTRGVGGTQPAAHNLQTEVVLTSEMPVESTAGFPPSGTIWIGIEKIGYTSLSPTAFLTLTRGIDKTEIYSHRAGVLARCGLYTDENPEPGSSVALYGVRRRIVPALGVLDQNTLDILAQERLLAFQDLKVWGSATVPAPSFLEDIDVGDEIAIVPAGGGSPDEYRLVGIVWRQMTGEIEIEYGATREAFLEDLTRLEKGVELATARGAVAMLGTVLSVSENGEVAQVLLDDGTTVWARIR